MQHVTPSHAQPAKRIAELCPLLLSAIALVACTQTATSADTDYRTTLIQPEISTRSIPLLEENSFTFRDLNKNGQLEPYEDWRLAPVTRATDLISRMTLEEKAGLMLHGSMSVFGDDAYDMSRAETLILRNHVGSVITRLASSASLLASENNKIQELAEQRRLGIPLSISTDPRSHFNYLAGASISAGNFSKWPEPLGLAAIGDPETTHRFADIARQEYRAVGIVQALSPMADLATEPRWPRVLGTFGEDATLAKSQTRAYVTGFQSGEQGLSSKSVASVVKHWAGYGAAKDGYDSHSYYGRFATFPGNNFEEHLTPFVGAFEANVSGVMPTFSILQDLIHNGVEQEQVGGGFNEYLLKDLLRESYGFEGVILSDWSITKDCNDVCKLGIADGKIQDRENISTAWGVIDRSPEERYALALTAGIDQFGGIDSPMYLLKAVSSGLVSEDRLDLSVRRLLIQKFKLGIFEKPFVDETLAQDIVGKNSFQEQAKIAQAKALVLLENKENLLPLGDKPLKVFLYEIDADAAREAGFDPVSTPEAADLAIMRLTTPFEQNHKNYMFGRRHHEGNLAYLPGNPDYDAVKSASQQVPVIATVFLERPAILTSIQNDVSALIGNFGVSDQVLFRVLKGDAEPQGNLPIELPSSMEAVVNQSEDLPYDSESPLYAFGYGLRYGGLSNEK